MNLLSPWALVVPAVLYAALVYTSLAVARLAPQKVRSSRRIPR